MSVRYSTFISIIKLIHSIFDPTQKSNIPPQKHQGTKISQRFDVNNQYFMALKVLEPLR